MNRGPTSPPLDSAMRVTTNTYPNTLVGQLNHLASRQAQLQTQVSTGQRVQSASDDPAAMQRVLNLQADASNVAQYQANIGAEQDRANSVYGALKSLKAISDRAGQIATLADGLKSSASLQTYAKEVTQLIQQAVQVANTQYNGTYLFAGTRNDQPAFVTTTDASGNITGVSYQGDQNVAMTQIAEGVTVTAQVPGVNTGGAGARGLITDSSTGADLFNHLISLQQHLAAGDTASIASTDRTQLTNDENNVIAQISENGVIQSRLQTSSTMLSDRATALTGRVSEQADADITTTLVQLSATQAAYQATLQTGAQLFKLSLMDYLQ